MFLQSDLMVYDVENFLSKYKRFMSKDIYIDKDLYTSFLSQYRYLFLELESNKYLFYEQDIFQQIYEILEDNCYQLLKLHNQKYLKKNYEKYSSFFDELYSLDVLNKNKRFMIMSLERRMVSIVSKNFVPYIVGKICYLNRFCNVDVSKILVLVLEKEDKSSIDSALKDVLNCLIIKRS